MTSGIQGPRGPGGPRDIGSAGAVGGPGEVGAAGAPLAAEVERLRAAREAGGVEPTDLGRLAADLDAGRITGDEALARILADSGMDLGELDGAELRELVADLVASDPYLAELAARIGARPGGDEG